MHDPAETNGHIPRCGAKNRDGTTCSRPPGWGTSHVGYGNCKNHAGSTPKGEKYGRRLMAEQAVATYGLPREVDPHTALSEELWRTAGHVSWLAEEVRKLDREHVSGPVGGGKNSESRFEPNVLIRMLMEERRHLLDVSRTCVAVGIEERRVRVVEELGGQIAQVLRNVLGDLGVADDPRVPEVVRRRLTEVAGE